MLRDACVAGHVEWPASLNTGRVHARRLVITRDSSILCCFFIENVYFAYIFRKLRATAGRVSAIRMLSFFGRTLSHDVNHVSDVLSPFINLFTYYRHFSVLSELNNVNRVP